MNPHNKTDYWNEIADTWQHSNRHMLLRSISDILNHRLLENWLPSEKVIYLLKTDLFDESLTDGLYPLLASKAKNVVGIDISQVTAARAKDRCCGMQAINADVRCLPWAADTFDIVISNSTLDHFQSKNEIIQSLGELNRVLKPHGHLLVTLDNYSHPLIFLRSHLPQTWLHRLGIVPYFTGVTLGVRGLKSALIEMGFTPVDETAFWHFPRILMGFAVPLLQKIYSDNDSALSPFFAFEFLSRLPTKYLSGQFIAIDAIKHSNQSHDRWPKASIWHKR